MISDPWIDRTKTYERSARTGRPYRTPQKFREYVARRRMELEKAGKCINGPLVGNVGRGGAVHGAPVRFGRCERCLEAYGR